MIKLKPCPFCGASGEAGYDERNDCWTPSCIGISCGAMLDTLFKTLEAAAEAWNRRTQPKSGAIEMRLDR